MKSGLIGIACIAVGLLVVDRVIRIQPFLRNRLEGFQQPVLLPEMGGRARACGVGLRPCPSEQGTKCGNGLCISTNPVPLVEKYPLPVLP